MKTILKQKFVLLAFCLLTIGSQSCSNETATTQELEEVYGTEELLAEVGVLNLYVGDESVAEEKYIVI